MNEEHKRLTLDAALRPLVASASLQGVVESLRRIVEKAAADDPSNDKWRCALNIIVEADRALYGQHCGDVP